MPVNLFNRSEKWSNKELSDCYVPVSEIGSISSGVACLKEMHELEDVSVINEILGLIKVDYVRSVEDISKGSITIKSVFSPESENFDLMEVVLDSIGIKKIDDWAFENEWRYKMSCLKISMLAGSKSAMRELKYIITPEYIDSPLREGIISEIAVLSSPFIAEEDINAADDFLQKQGIDKKVERSQLKIINR